MKTNIQITIDAELAEELRKQNNFSSLINNLVKDYFNKMAVQSVSEIEKEIKQTKKDENSLKKKDASSELPCELSGKRPGRFRKHVNLFTGWILGTTTPGMNGESND